jgi:hypothetical protein
MPLGLVGEVQGHTMARGVTAARLTLDQVVMVRIHAGQQNRPERHARVRPASPRAGGSWCSPASP